MKKIYSVIAGLALLSVSFSACVEQNDFNGEVSFNELKPTFLLPLVYDTLTLFNGEYFTYAGDTAAFFYPIGNIKLPDISVWFPMSFPRPCPISVPTNRGTNGVPFVQSGTFSFPIAEPGSNLRIDSAYMDIRIDVEDLALWLIMPTDTLTISSNNILINNVPLSYTFTGPDNNHVPLTYTHCLVKPTANSLTLNTRINATANQSTQFATTVTVTFEDYTIIYGDFGNRTRTYTDHEVTFDFLKDLNISGNIEFTELKLALNIENSIDIPLQLKIDKATVYNKDGTTSINNPFKPMNIKGPPADSIFTIIVNKDTLRSTPELAKKINLSTSKIVFDYSVTSNYGTATPKNSLTKTAEIKVHPVGTGVLMPLQRVKASNLVLTDIMDVDLSSVKFHEMELNATFSNSMPADLKLQFTLLEKNTGNLLSNLFKEPIEIKSPEVGTDGTVPLDTYEVVHTIVPIQPEALKDMKNSNKAMLTIYMNTKENDYVSFLKSSVLGLKLSAKTQLSYDELFK